MSISLKRLKEEAKRLHKETGCGRARAHEIVARSYGFKTYNAFLAQDKPK